MYWLRYAIIAGLMAGAWVVSKALQRRSARALRIFLLSGLLVALFAIGVLWDKLSEAWFWEETRDTKLDEIADVTIHHLREGNPEPVVNAFSNYLDRSSDIPSGNLRRLRVLFALERDLGTANQALHGNAGGREDASPSVP